MASVALNTGERFRIGRVFNESFAIIGRNLPLCLGLGAAFHALPRFAAWLWYVKSGAGQHSFQAFVIQHPLVSILAVPLYLVLTVVLQTSLIRATIVDLRGEKPDFSDCFGFALALLFPILGLSLLATAGIAIGMVLLIVPGILLTVRWAVAMPVLIQERRGILDSMSRSRDLTSGSRWALLGLWLMLIAANVMTGLVINHVAIPLNVTFGLLADATVRAAILVFSSVANAVSYAELRRTKEGTSVDELAKIFS
ncbi:hypothetical protein [Mesorhizobium sp.]|uniref:hypothetical protein n=1 Tax=Mesorhizobium sp. TaxID=1871066 RepID=UPI0025FE3198|nr:hypothetical protein [Mesorhizobium sp.]